MEHINTLRIGKRRTFPLAATTLLIICALLTPALAQEIGSAGYENAKHGMALVEEGRVEEGLAILTAEAARKNWLSLLYLSHIYDENRSGPMYLDRTPDLARCWQRKYGALRAPPPVLDEHDLRWNLTAAQHGYPGAQQAMAHAYADGKLVERDMIEAGAWFMLSFDRVSLEWSYTAMERVLRHNILETINSDAIDNIQARVRELYELPTMQQDFPCPLTTSD